MTEEVLDPGGEHKKLNLYRIKPPPRYPQKKAPAVKRNASPCREWKKMQRSMATQNAENKEELKAKT